MFLDKKTLLKIGLNPGLNLTIIRGTGSSMVDSQREWLEASHIQQALVENIFIVLLKQPQKKINNSSRL